jgi:enterochelin esterase family protein
MGVLFCALAVAAQPAQPGPGAGQPAPPRSPEVLADGTVTFRLLAPNAAAVTLGGDHPVGASVAMAKDDQGVWSATVGPLKADFYSYYFTVDGVRTLDWRNASVMRDGARYASRGTATSGSSGASACATCCPGSSGRAGRSR